MLLVLLAIGLALALLPSAHTAYHEWRFGRFCLKALVNPQNCGASERATYHRDRLVAIGAYDLFKYKFEHVDSATPKARTIVQLIISRRSPPHLEFLSPAPQAGRPLEISILCRPEQLAAWRVFASDQDVP
jgi:hypothetical protein